MDLDRRPLSRALTWRLQIIAPDVIALVVLAYLLWAISLVLTFPYDGSYWVQSSGLVSGVEIGSPSEGLLQVGDIVLSIDGMPWEQGIPDYREIGAGKPVEFAVIRDGKMQRVSITLVKPPITELFRRLSPLLVAAIFWIVGVSVHLFNPPVPATRQFFVLFISSTLLLVSGLMSSFDWPTSSLFGFLVWMIGPLGIHLHLYFPQEIMLQRKRQVLGIAYVVGLLGGMLQWIWGSRKMAQLSLGWSLAGRIYLMCSILIVIFLLLYAYYRAPTSGTRGKVRLIALGCSLSLLPLVFLSVLPEMLFQQPILGYHFAFLLLSILPLSYGFVFFRQRLAKIDRRVSRGATYLTIYLVLGSLLAVALMLVHRYRPLTVDQIPLIGAIALMVLISVYAPFHRAVQKFIDNVFYGGWYDYRSATVQLAQALDRFGELLPLAETVSYRLARTLRLQAAAVLLRDDQGNFSILAISPAPLRGVWPLAGIPILPEKSLARFQELGIVDKATLHNLIHDIELSDDERRLLGAEDINLWVPVRGHAHIQGLLALGPKYGGDVFSHEDLDILDLLARQLGPVVDNIHLLNQLRSYAAQLELKVDERTQELYNAKERVEAILASVGDGVIVTDLEGHILTVNDAIERKSGYQASELIGQELKLLYNGRNSSQAFLAMQASLGEGLTWSGELVARRKDGDTFVVQITIAPVRDQRGQIIGYVGSQRDITQQKQLEQLKDQMVLGFSHNLRTPIANIYLYLDLIENEDPEIQERALKVLKEQSQLLKSMLEDVLALQMLTINGQESPEFIQVDLNELAQMTVEKHLTVVAASGLEINFEPGDGLPLVEGAPRQLVTVIANLLSNAFRYTRAGEVRVRTFLDGDRVVLEVLDTGAGITAEDLPHIFEPFYRGRSVRESELIGSGLGLAIAREIARMHSGSISVASEPGEGSKFRLYLPV